MKIWAKLMVEHKNIKDVMIENDITLNYSTYEELLRQIAYALDIATPLTLKSHYNHLMKFNSHKYKSYDFVETINFDYLEIENYTE